MIIKDNNQPEKWNLRYFSPNGGKYPGTMTLSNGDIIFNSRNNFNRSSFSFKIDSSDISYVCDKSGLFKEEIIISVNEKKHIFMKYSLRSKKIIERIKQLTKQKEIN
ncbi:MAG: GRAM domain-containing protein [Bacteroidales bacterium]|nr:GRAM domain-containing protein [Bacteroidales bacterium]